MSDNTLIPTSRTDWTKVAALSDAEIDTSDVPPLDDAFFARASVRMPNRTSENERVELTAAEKVKLRRLVAPELK